MVSQYNPFHLICIFSSELTSIITIFIIIITIIIIVKIFITYRALKYLLAFSLSVCFSKVFYHYDKHCLQPPTHAQTHTHTHMLKITSRVYTLQQKTTVIFVLLTLCLIRQCHYLLWLCNPELVQIDLTQRAFSICQK